MSTANCIPILYLIHALISMSEFADSELSATQTEGYKVGEKKTAEELANVSY